MIKTEMQIERDFYDFVSASTLGTTIRGNIYRSEMRPHNATEEDLVVKFLAGYDTQIQYGIVVFNIYVPDIAWGEDGRKVADKARIAELQQAVLLFADEASASGEYRLETDGTPRTYYNEDIEQHLIAARFSFKRLTE